MALLTDWISTNTVRRIRTGAAKYQQPSIIHVVQGALLATPAAGDTIWDGSSAYTWPSAAAKVAVAAGGNAADTAAGTGARTVTVNGLSSTWERQVNTLTLAGASASSDSTNTFIRVWDAFVATAGSGGTNAAAVTVGFTGGGSTLAVIRAEAAAEGGCNRSYNGFFSVPLGYVARIQYLNNPDALMAVRFREFGGLWQSVLLPGLADWESWGLANVVFPAKSDIEFRATEGVAQVVTAVVHLYATS